MPNPCPFYPWAMRRPKLKGDRPEPLGQREMSRMWLWRVKIALPVVSERFLLPLSPRDFNLFKMNRKRLDVLWGKNRKLVGYQSPWYLLLMNRRRVSQLVMIKVERMKILRSSPQVCLHWDGKQCWTSSKVLSGSKIKMILQVQNKSVNMTTVSVQKMLFTSTKTKPGVSKRLVQTLKESIRSWQNLHVGVPWLHITVGIQSNHQPIIFSAASPNLNWDASWCLPYPNTEKQ